MLNVDGGAGNIGSDPNFVDGDNDDYHLATDSPCIDAGDPNQTYTDEEDFDGQVRAAGTVDIGADEVARVHNTTQDKWYVTIQDALDEANSADIIEAHPGIYNESIDFAGLSVTVRSADPNDRDTVAATVIDAGDAASDVVIFENGEDANAVLSGLVITGGYAGIFCDGASPTINKCIVRQNNCVGLS